MRIWVAAENDLATTGGPAEHLTGLWNAMRRRGHEVRLSVPPLTGAPARKIDFELDAPPLGPGPRQLAFQFSLWRRWSRDLRQKRPDCIFLRAGQWLFAPALLAHRKKIPLFVEVNGISARHLAARGLSAPLLKTAEWVERFDCTHATRVLAISPAVGEWLTQKYKLNGASLSLVPAGVDCAEFSPAKKETSLACRRMFGLGPEVQIGFVGTFDWWQGLPNFLRVLAWMREQNAGGNWRAVIAGYGAEEAALRAQVRELKLDERVRFLGRVQAEEAHLFLRALDIGVLPRTDYAPAPTKLLQYFASGLASVYPALPDLLWLGEAGLTYDPQAQPNTEKGLAGALTKLCEDVSLRAKLGERSRQLSLARFDWKIVAEQVEKILSA
jgi:glycosyltransferase involved in cell wall biosynthesis